MSEVRLTSAPDPWVKVYKDQIELDEALEFWQRTLRIQDWTITAEIVRDRDLGSSGRGGEIWIKEKRKAAKIRLLDPIDYSPTCWEAQDMEYFLVHECVHVLTNAIRRDGDAEDAGLEEEQAVDAIAHALVSLRRSK